MPVARVASSGSNEHSLCVCLAGRRGRGIGEGRKRTRVTAISNCLHWPQRDKEGVTGLV